MIYVTDTHSLVWFLAKDSKLGNEALRIFRSADEGRAVVIIPSIVIAELIYIAENKNAGVKFADLLYKLDESLNYVVRNLDMEILKEAAKYKQLKDMHDRIIVATAETANAVLITKDADIKNSGKVETVW